MMTDTGMLEKVRALLNKAERTDSTHEAEALTAKAVELMAKYSIDAALVAANTPTSEVVGDRRIFIAAPYAPQRCTLLYRVATQMRCKGIRSHRQNNGYTMHLFGYPSDLDAVEMLYTSLVVQAARAVERADVPSYDSARSFRTSYLEGFSNEIHSRLRAIRLNAESEARHPSSGSGMSTDLVLADRQDVVDRTYAEAYPKTGKTSTSVKSGAGYGAGKVAGRNADLGQKRVGETQPQLKG